MRNSERSAERNKLNNYTERKDVGRANTTVSNPPSEGSLGPHSGCLTAPTRVTPLAIVLMLYPHFLDWPPRTNFKPKTASKNNVQ